MKSQFKKIITKFASSPLLMSLGRASRRENIPIFMLHRFADPDRGVVGHSPCFLRVALEYLRDQGYCLLSLDQLVKALDGQMDVPDNAVVFTLDDGFYDQLAIAAPIFREFSCPATIFLITDFSSLVSWPWDYQVEHIINCTLQSRVVMGGVAPIDSQIETIREKQNVISYIHDRLKTMATEQAQQYTNRLAEKLGVALTTLPPDSYWPITWDLARSAEDEFIQFGAHTSSHSILSSQSCEICSFEVATSLRSLKLELINPSDIFCYPTGRNGIDFGPRDMNIVESSGFRAALSVDPGYVNVGNDGLIGSRYCLKRFAFPNNLEDFIQICSGLELTKKRVKDFFGFGLDSEN